MFQRTAKWGIAAAAAVALVLTGCTGTGSDTGDGNPDGNNEGPVTIEFWSMPFGGHTEEDVAAYVDEFNESQDDIVVELTGLQWADGRDKIIQAVGAGTGPDVFIMAPVNQDFLSSGSLASLADLGYSQEDVDPFLDIIEAAAGYDGEVYGVPIGYYTNVLYYNATILEQYGFDGPPETWDELKDTAATITTESAAAGDPVMGFQIKGMDDHLNAINHTWANFFYQAGGEQLIDDLTKANAYSQSGREALEYLRSFVEEGISTPGPSAKGGFIDGTVAMFTFQQLHLPEIAASTLTDEWGLAPMPEGPDTASSYTDGEFLVANAASDELEAAGTFMKWMTSPEQGVRYMEKAPLFAYELDAVSDEVRGQVEALIEADPNRGALLEQLQRASLSNIIAERYAQAARWEAQKQYIVAAINGDMSIDDALAAIDAAVDEALEVASY